MFVSPPEVGMPRSCSSVVVNPGAASTRTAQLPCHLPAAALPAAANATPTGQRRQCLEGRCLPILRWLRCQKPNKPQPQQHQPLEQPYQQQSNPNGARLPEHTRLQSQQKLQLQERLQLQHRRLQQLMQKQEHQSQQQTYKQQQQLQQQTERQESELILLMGQLDTAGLSTPYTGWGSSGSSKGLSSKNSGTSVGPNASALGTPGHISGSSNSSSRSSSVSSSEGSRSCNSGRSKPRPLSPSGCTTSGHSSLKSAGLLEPSMLCSNSRPRSHYIITNSPREGGCVAAAPVPGRNVSAGNRCGTANTAAVTDTSLAAPLSDTTRAAAAVCAAGGDAATADQCSGGDATSLAARATMEVPLSGLLTGRPTRSQAAEAAMAPEKPAAEGKSGTPGTSAGPVSRTGAAADATDEWEGPNLLDTPVHKKDPNGRLEIQQQQQQQQEQSRMQQQSAPQDNLQPVPQKQQQPALQDQQQREQMRGTGGRRLSPVASGTSVASAVPPLPPQSTAAAHAAAPAAQATVASTSVAVLSGAPSRLASRIVEPSAASRPGTSITDTHCNQQQPQQRRQLDDFQLPTLPLLGGDFDAAQGSCGSSVPRFFAGESEKDADQRNTYPNNRSSVGRGAQSQTTTRGVIVDASSAIASVVRAGGTVATQAASAKDDNVQTSRVMHRQQLDCRQKLEKQTLDTMRTERQANVRSPSQQQDQRVQPRRLEPSPTPRFKGKPHTPRLPPGNPDGSHSGASGGPRNDAVGAAAAIELAATVVGAAASTAAETIAPSAESLVASVTQSVSSLLATGPPGCSLLALRRQRQPKQEQHQKEAILYHEEQQDRQYNVPVLPSPSTSSLQQKQQQRTQEQQIFQHMLYALQPGQRKIQQPLLESSVSPLPPAGIQASRMLQQLPSCDVRHQQEQKQHQLLLPRLQASAPQGSQTGTYATSRSQSPARLQLRCSVPSVHYQLQQQLLLLQDEQQRHAPPAKQTVEVQRAFFGVHLSAEAEAAAASAAGAAAAAATAVAARPSCGGKAPPPSDPFVAALGLQQVQGQQERKSGCTCCIREVSGCLATKAALVRATAAKDPEAPGEDFRLPRGNCEASYGGVEFSTGNSRPPSPAGVCSAWPQEGTPAGRRSPAGQQAAEASRRAMLLRKNSQSSLLHICTAASQDQQLQQPHLEQQQARWETRSSHAIPLAAAAAAATAAAAALARTKLEDCETSPTDFSSNSTNVTSDVPSANSMHSALTPQLLHHSRRTPFPLQQPGAEVDPAPEGAATVAERPPTPVRAERLRKRLERLRDMGQLSRDTYPAAEVASLIRGARVEKEGPFAVYVLDKDWSLGCSALDPDWPQKMLQNTKEGIKLHSEINRLLALAKEVDLAQAKRDPQ